ncbi:MAG: hypothetical protein ACI8PT_004830 [Gammaproteobacteria bacterium]|jgi:hypothetical protein
MITKTKIEELVEQKLIASVRVVPVPLTRRWCIDTIVRAPLEAGSATDTVATPTPNNDLDKLRKFDTIDDATNFLRSVGIRTFTVDTNDAVSFAHLDGNALRMLKTTMQLWESAETSAA